MNLVFLTAVHSEMHDKRCDPAVGKTDGVEEMGEGFGAVSQAGERMGQPLVLSPPAIEIVPSSTFFFPF